MIQTLIFPNLSSAYEILTRRYFIVHLIELSLHQKWLKQEANSDKIAEGSMN